MSSKAQARLPSASLLIVEDEAKLRLGLRDFTKQHGFTVHTAENGSRALACLKETHFDLILTDMKLPGISGLPLINALCEQAPQAQIIVMTAYGSVQEAVQAMKAGIYDYLTKPLNLEEMLHCFAKALEKKRLIQEVRELRRELHARYSFGAIIGKSRRMQEVYAAIEKVARTDATVLITGESGTGKELVSRAIHYNSRRQSGPFITLACTSIPEGLIASELFGYEKGAFTGAYRKKVGKFEAAHRGTLFIDEIADLGPGIQLGLLRFLQEREFERVGGVESMKADVRVITATNRDLHHEVQSQLFREDLYYRINVVPIYLPPLRERKEDIPLLADHFLKKYNKITRKKIQGVTVQGMIALMAYSWPGNVRELEHALERAIILAPSGEWLGPEYFYPAFPRRPDQPPPPVSASGLALAPNIRCLEHYLILRALEKAGGNKTAAAKLLGITYRALRYKLQKLDFDNGTA